MPNTREKLIELVESGHGYYYTEEYKGSNVYAAIADHLISNGVTIPEWISVKDRLPDRNDMVIAFYPTMRGTSGEMQIHKAWAMSETCTHWMPLPEPPKGE